MKKIFLSIFLLTLTSCQSNESLRFRLEAMEGVLFKAKNEIDTLKEQNSKLLGIVYRLDNKGRISLTDTGAQSIDEDFLLSKLDLKEQLGGLKVSGRVINKSSILHTNADFKIEIGNSENNFTINKISPGSSSPFSVFIPNVDPKNIGSAYMHYNGSAVGYSL